MNEPDIEAVDEVILESVNAWKNYKKRIQSMSSADRVHRAEVMFTLNSWDLTMWFPMISESG